MEVCKVEGSMGLICFIINILFPGWGTILSTILGEPKMDMMQIVFGILQFILSSFLIGWLWSIYWGFLIWFVLAIMFFCDKILTIFFLTFHEIQAKEQRIRRLTLYESSDKTDPMNKPSLRKLKFFKKQFLLVLFLFCQMFSYLLFFFWKNST